MQGVSTRKIKAVSEDICGYEFSAGTISELNATLHEEPERFARQRLEGEHPYLILDARYEKLREDGANQELKRRTISCASSPTSRSGGT